MVIVPTLKQIVKAHPNCFILIAPKLRDAISNKPKSFKVLQTTLTTDSCEKALAYYEAHGFGNVVALPNFNARGRVPELPSRHMAKLFRVLYGRE